ncbi:hypothetical protein KC19_6G155100 [Ceratodon purpureus]|uniref:dolichyl-P-Man:Man5GlcNAc2-PP-dolichol alpha-1,3-mannosyltransferase n=1 Tax=Ceratodon purpureus TaxID=3225 RepID=A0A8T0HID6_CERPU|nr:hypothetical protein KC19_6G155100 [Ceratodon purpureus]
MICELDLNLCWWFFCGCAFGSPDTKIDWDAYMSQVTGFLAGERNYAEIHGDTGPLVYPAGFLYIYSGIQYITGGAVFPAQILFGVLYVINLGLVLLIYIRAQAVPWWALSLLCLSKRIHSIFVLRLFNDCVATTLMHASVALMQQQHWHLALTVFSAAVSVKMNVLLLAPPVLLLLLKSLTVWGVLTSLGCAAILQVLVGMPFLLTYPMEYFSRAFNLGRVFIHFWSVNFKFVPEDFFISKPFALSLLILHLGFLFVFAQYKWCRHEGGILRACGPQNVREEPKKSDLNVVDKFLRSVQSLSANHILTVVFTGNFIGIVFARSLHYQFYSWYFYSLPFLLWKTTFPTPVRLAIFFGTELCWNVYPSTPVSSVALLLCHVSLLAGLWFAPSEYPYVDRTKEIKKS